MSSVRITQLPTLPSLTASNASSVFIPVVEGGVTRKIPISSLLQYRTSGTLAQVLNGSSVAITSSQSTGRATLNLYLPGAVTQFSGTQIPSGWLLCYGQAISRSTYVNLFSVIGVTYGVGDNRSTFNVPDLRGRTAFGNDSMGVSAAGRLTNSRPGGVYGSLGSTGGEETHTLTEDETPVCPHTHSVLSTWDYSYNRGEGGNRCNQGTSYDSMLNGANNDSAPSSYSLNGGVSSNTSAVTPHINVPPLVFLNYIIKY